MHKIDTRALPMGVLNERRGWAVKLRERGLTLRNAIQQNPNLAEARLLLLLGVTQLERGKALAGGVSGLGAIATQQGDYASARRYLEDAVALDPRDAEAWLRKGNLAVMERRYSDAQAALAAISGAR